ncbi:hypothetical protein [Clostridium sp.]|uniref:hypothetical protein n=1 Tax=Clostridium sp. TaxID=1506 RepID=UPI00290C1F49|nr:hypothetical protein [Clostridium sp.]MDU3409998.1 hypothetical protein [Clostridium sp.]
MKKVAINKCYGGFGLSLKAQEMLWRLKGYNNVCFYKQEYLDDNEFKYEKISDLYKDNLFSVCVKKDYGDITYDIKEEDFIWDSELFDDREDRCLVKVIEDLGDKANGRFSNLKIVEIPDDVEYEIDEYDGIESIHEIHRVWS